MNPVVIIICLFVIACVSFFIAYYEDKKNSKGDHLQVRDLVDSPSILFEDSSKKNDTDDNIEII